MEPGSSVCVVGYSAIDILSLHQADTIVRIGGVCTNVARVLGALGVHTTIITPKYFGELGRLLRCEFEQYRVKLQHLPVSGPLALFTAQVSSQGELLEEHFQDFGVGARTSVESIRGLLRSIQPCPQFLVACTDFELNELKVLRRIATEDLHRLCLVVTCVEEVGKVAALQGQLDLLSINLRELQELTRVRLLSINDIVVAAKPLVTSDGIAVISMGGDGAVLVDKRSRRAWHQSVPIISCKTSVGAGDVLTGGLIAEYLGGASWEVALSRAVSRTLRYLSQDEHAALPFFAVAELWDQDMDLPRAVDHECWLSGQPEKVSSFEIPEAHR
jgi:fructose-1-phosphate kinase PfkB-like protein